MDASKLGLILINLQILGIPSLSRLVGLLFVIAPPEGIEKRTGGIRLVFSYRGTSLAHIAINLRPNTSNLKKRERELMKMFYTLLKMILKNISWLAIVNFVEA